METLELQNKINVPFADKGDKINVPDSNSDGTVNMTDGFGSKYDTPIAEGGEYIYREEMNYILNKIYAAVKEIQELAVTAGFPIDMTKALNVLGIANGGTNANNAQDAANNILKAVATNTSLNNTDYVYIYADSAVKRITLTNLVSKIIPIGFIYIQYRNQSTPDILFGTDGKWQDVSAEYAGEFFRAVGGNSGSFGVTQAEGLPNITGLIDPVSGLFKSNFRNGAFSGGGDWRFSPVQQNSSGNESAECYFNASSSNSIYGASTHVTPYNSSIRIWKKIS